MKIPTPPTSAPEIGYGLCHCGCGLTTKLSTQNHSRRGLVKGEPYKFIKGHYHKSSVDCLLDEKTGCWEWQRSKNDGGYGIFPEDGKLKSAHRHYFKLEFGELPDELDVCHTCDNPGCVNPSHMFLGTAQDNSDDMVLKGRSAHLTGEDHGMQKINKKDILSIRDLSKTYSQRKIASHFGISQSQVWRIVHEQSWLDS